MKMEVNTDARLPRVPAEFTSAVRGIGGKLINASRRFLSFLHPRRIHSGGFRDWRLTEWTPEDGYPTSQVCWLVFGLLSLRPEDSREISLRFALDPMPGARAARDVGDHQSRQNPFYRVMDCGEYGMTVRGEEGVQNVRPGKELQDKSCRARGTESAAARAKTTQGQAGDNNPDEVQTERYRDQHAGRKDG